MGDNLLHVPSPGPVTEGGDNGDGRRGPVAVGRKRTGDHVVVRDGGGRCFGCGVRFDGVIRCCGGEWLFWRVAVMRKATVVGSYWWD